jgi:hypothetical protein
MVERRLTGGRGMEGVVVVLDTRARNFAFQSAASCDGREQEHTHMFEEFSDQHPLHHLERFVQLLNGRGLHLHFAVLTRFRTALLLEVIEREGGGRRTEKRARTHFWRGIGAQLTSLATLSTGGLTVALEVVVAAIVAGDLGHVPFL